MVWKQWYQRRVRGIVSVVCDGCSWGARSREASLRAARAFVEHLRSPEIQRQMKDTMSIKKIFRQTLDICHEAIKEGKESCWEAGTTTLCGGMLYKVKDMDCWAFQAISVGDCKIIHYSSSMELVKDVTYGNRTCASDAADCGGRIGPYVGNGEPDLRNLTYHFVPLYEGDLVCIVTDGIYDNLDPSHLGHLPRQYGCPQYQKWSEMDPQIEIQIKGKYMSEKILQFINREKKPLLIAQALVENSRKLTMKTRMWMETHPNSAEPKNYVEYPGKMDHCTCLVMKVKESLKLVSFG
eukprot:TRINITY_DN12429_c0_g1_i2.p1 TRINITY_DN12429_c0_g1~~TRINITY_DN12429_c0_g1_i2.p1  ORF type:complete len:295 (+),score=81.92 TRINITY_DN12429_c0_g1_i2:103-987(+)